MSKLIDAKSYAEERFHFYKNTYNKDFHSQTRSIYRCLFLGIYSKGQN